MVLSLLVFYTIVEYIPNAAFKHFAEQVAQAHLDGGHDKTKL